MAHFARNRKLFPFTWPLYARAPQSSLRIDQKLEWRVNFRAGTSSATALNSADRLRSVFACSVKYLSCYVLIKHIFRDKEAQVSSKHAKGLRAKRSTQQQQRHQKDEKRAGPVVRRRRNGRFSNFISDAAATNKGLRHATDLFIVLMAAAASLRHKWRNGIVACRCPVLEIS